MSLRVKQRTCAELNRSMRVNGPREWRSRSASQQSTARQQSWLAVSTGCPTSPLRRLALHASGAAQTCVSSQMPQAVQTRISHAGCFPFVAPSVILAGLRGIQALCRGDAGQQHQAVRAGILPALLCLIRRFAPASFNVPVPQPRNTAAQIVREALSCLGSLVESRTDLEGAEDYGCVGRRIAIQLTVTGGGDMIAHAAQGFLEDAPTQLFFLRAVHVVLAQLVGGELAFARGESSHTRRNEDSMADGQLFVTKTLVLAVIEVMKAHESIPNIVWQGSALLVLMFQCTEATKQILLESRGCDIVGKAVADHVYVGEIQEQLCRLIWLLCQGEASRRLRTALRQTSALLFIPKLRDVHNHKAGVCKWAMAASEALGLKTAKQ